MRATCSSCGLKYDIPGNAATIECWCGQTLATTVSPLKDKGLPELVPSAGSACPWCDHTCEGGTCNQCGFEISTQAEIARGNSAPLCPVCPNSKLTKRTVSGVLLEDCEECRGIWLEVEIAKTVMKPGFPLAEELLEPGANNANTTWDGARPNGKLYIQCPACDLVMNRTNFAGMSGIIIDVCRYHGTWFDPTELSRVVSFVREGGLEKARSTEKLGRDNARDENPAKSLKRLFAQLGEQLERKGS